MKPDFSFPSRIEEAYRRSLMALIREFMGIVGGMDITEPQQILDALRSFYGSDFFRQQSWEAASRMVTGLQAVNARTWREAATSGMMGRELYALLNKELSGPIGAKMQSIVKENARLISTFPEDIAIQVNTFVKNESLKGRRGEAIAADLIEQFPGVARSRIALIARTETAKASTALNRVRCDELGLSWYVWRVNRDVRLRSSHRHMADVVCAFSDPPNPEGLNGEKRSYGNYGPGEIFNCRCHVEPLIRLSQVSWPHKVHISGSIQWLTRADFARISHMEGGLENAA